MEERKITLVDDDQTLEFYVVEETKLNGANYLLVTDAEDDDEEGDCYILKDMSVELHLVVRHEKAQFLHDLFFQAVQKV